MRGWEVTTWFYSVFSWFWWFTSWLKVKVQTVSCTARLSCKSVKRKAFLWDTFFFFFLRDESYRAGNKKLNWALVCVAHLSSQLTTTVSKNRQEGRSALLRSRERMEVLRELQRESREICHSITTHWNELLQSACSSHILLHVVKASTPELWKQEEWNLICCHWLLL